MEVFLDQTLKKSFQLLSDIDKDLKKRILWRSQKEKIRGSLKDLRLSIQEIGGLALTIKAQLDKERLIGKTKEILLDEAEKKLTDMTEKVVSIMQNLDPDSIT